jgi:hypothetical protein
MLPEVILSLLFPVVWIVVPAAAQDQRKRGWAGSSKEENSRSIVKIAVIAKRLEHLLKTGGQVHAISGNFDGRIHLLKINDRKQFFDGFMGPFEDARFKTFHVDFDEIHSVQLQIIDSQALHPLPGNQVAGLVIRFDPIRRTGQAPAAETDV